MISVRERVYVVNAHCHLGNSISCHLSLIMYFTGLTIFHPGKKVKLCKLIEM